MQRRKDELEVWKPFPLKPSVEVSTLGRVKKDGELVKPSSSGGNGYLRVSVGLPDQYRYVHRLVLLTFTEQPVKKNHIRHINGNPQDNRLCNLEWSTNAECLKRAGEEGKLSHGTGATPVIATKLETGEVTRYPSQQAFSKEIGADERGSSVNKALRGKRKTTHGYKVEYADMPYEEKSVAKDSGRTTNYVEMIIDYAVDGTGFQYNDNKGILTRCKDCVFADSKSRTCCNFNGLRGELSELDYCSGAVRKVDHNP